jgi:hypothetical protein
MGCHNSFLIRVWKEDGDNLIRGYIQHVGTEEDIYFLKWGEMVDFLLGHIDWHINQRVCEDESDFYLHK